MLYDKFHNRYIVTGKLIAVDPIHIGSSSKNSLNPVDVDNSVLKDNNGRAVIPGSSIKGVVRSYFESVLRSIDENKACDVLDEKKCCTLKKQAVSKLKEAKKSPEKYAKVVEEVSCDVCKLFGGREIAGKLHFKDCYLIGEPSYEHRDGVGISRETGAADTKNHAKYDFEIVSKDSEFEFTMTADNIDPQQKKYFDFIVAAIKDGNLAVGGKTTRGLGRFRIDDVKIKEITADDMKANLGL